MATLRCGSIELYNEGKQRTCGLGSSEYARRGRRPISRGVREEMRDSLRRKSAHTVFDSSTDVPINPELAAVDVVGQRCQGCLSDPHRRESFQASRASSQSLSTQMDQVALGIPNEGTAFAWALDQLATALGTKPERTVICLGNTGELSVPTCKSVVRDYARGQHTYDGI